MRIRPSPPHRMADAQPDRFISLIPALAFAARRQGDLGVERGGGARMAGRAISSLMPGPVAGGRRPASVPEIAETRIGPARGWVAGSAGLRAGSWRGRRP